MDVRQVAVADDLGLRIVGLQTDEQGAEGALLRRCTGVGITTLGIETALVADADAVLVVVAGVGTDDFFRATEVQLSVAGDVVVVAAALPAPGTMAPFQVVEGETPVATCGGAVDDDEVYASHGNFYG